MHHDFEPNSFDVAYSRDTILHISDKMTLFSRLYVRLIFKKIFCFLLFIIKQNWLKPGGQLFITDYTCAPKHEWSKDYEEYVNQRRYTLLTVTEYGKVKKNNINIINLLFILNQLLESVGFKDVDARDATEKFVECLKMELTRIESIKDDFIQVCLSILFLIQFVILFIF